MISEVGLPTQIVGHGQTCILASRCGEIRAHYKYIQLCTLSDSSSQCLMHELDLPSVPYVEAQETDLGEIDSIAGRQIGADSRT